MTHLKSATEDLTDMVAAVAAWHRGDDAGKVIAFEVIGKPKAGGHAALLAATKGKVTITLGKGKVKRERILLWPRVVYEAAREHRPTLPYRGELAVEITFILPPKGPKTLDALTQTTMVALEGGRFWMSPSQVAELVVRRRTREPGEKEGARIRVTFLPFKGKGP